MSMLRGILVVLSIALIVLSVTLTTGGVFFMYKLAGGQVIDLGTVGEWWFLLRSYGLEVSHSNRILFTVNPFATAIVLVILPAFHMIFVNARHRRNRRRGFAAAAPVEDER
jgi:hypothetical protein